MKVPETITDLKEKQAYFGKRNYKNGRNKEYRIIAKEREKGNLAFRSAGSHSAIDIISIDHKNKSIKLIQSKPASMSDNAKTKIEKDNEYLNGLYTVEFFVN